MKKPPNGINVSGPPRAVRWAVGVTTVPSRKSDLLPRTLASLRDGGFSNIRLFVDGAKSPTWWESAFNTEVTCHYPALGAYGNWITALWELYLRNNQADRYAIFQDDLVCSFNLRQYLEQQPYPELPSSSRPTPLRTITGTSSNVTPNVATGGLLEPLPVSNERGFSAGRDGRHRGE